MSDTTYKLDYAGFREQVLEGLVDIVGPDVRQEVTPPVLDNVVTFNKNAGVPATSIRFDALRVQTENTAEELAM